MAADRIAARFARLKADGRAAFVSFITAGDPDRATSAGLLAQLPAAGVDVIELGMPFSDPMADGPAIQAASLRAIRAGMTLKGTLDLVRDFRTVDHDTPIVLMGYYNPIYIYGVDRFITDALAAGVDGLIVVDLPPEEDDELCLPALKAGLSFIRLATPTTDDKRLPQVLKNTSGFVYYVSITGITGARTGDTAAVAGAVTRLKCLTALPVVVGFGLKTADAVATVAESADGAVVGSAIVSRIAAGLDASGHATENLVPEVMAFVRNLAEGVRRNPGGGRRAAVG